MIMIHVEFDSFDQDCHLITWVKGITGPPTGGTPSDHSEGHLSPGGECFAPRCGRSAPGSNESIENITMIIPCI